MAAKAYGAEPQVTQTLIQITALALPGLLIEVNADFFSRHLEPSLKRTTARLQAAAGRISPPSSPAPDTESAR